MKTVGEWLAWYYETRKRRLPEWADVEELLRAWKEDNEDLNRIIQEETWGECA